MAAQSQVWRSQKGCLCGRDLKDPVGGPELSAVSSGNPELCAGG